MNYLSMECVEDLITDNWKAGTDNLSSFFLENTDYFIQHEVRPPPTDQGHFQTWTVVFQFEHWKHKP